MYLASFEQYAFPHFGRMKLAEVGREDVRAYIAVLHDAGLAHASVKKHLAPVKAMFACACDDGALRDNPATRVRVNKQKDRPKAQPEPKALTSAELAAFLREVPDDWRLFFDLLVATGLRVSEALGLNCGDVNPGVAGGQPKLRVERQWYRGDPVGPQDGEERPHAAVVARSGGPAMAARRRPQRRRAAVRHARGHPAI